MPTHNVVLTDHHEKIIQTLVGAGRYQDVSELVRDGLRLVEEREARNAARLAALREAAQVGWTALDEGRYRELDDDELESFIQSLGRRAGERVRAA